MCAYMCGAYHMGYKKKNKHEQAADVTISLSMYMSLSFSQYMYIYIYIYASGAVIPHPSPPNVDVALPTSLWCGVGLELVTHPHNMAPTCMRTALPTAPPENE